MPVTINATQFNELQVIYNKSLNGTDVRVEYYNKLISFGDKYAELAKGVVTNTGFSGRVANAYMAEVARDQGKPFTASENLLFSKDLMTRDFVARKTAFDNKALGGNIELGYEAIENYHKVALDLKLKLDPIAWTAYAPLLLGKTPAEKQAIWDLMINKDGGLALKEYGTIFMNMVIDSASNTDTSAQSKKYLSQFFLSGEMKEQYPQLYEAALKLAPMATLGAGFIPNSVGWNGVVGISDLKTGFESAVQFGSNARFGLPVEKFQGVSDGTCFASSTTILTPKGEALIQDLEVGDAVMAFDGFGELVSSKVVNLQRKTTDTWIELSFDNKTIKATPNHRMFTPSGDFATLSEMIAQSQNNHLQLVDAQGKTVDVAFTIITLDVPEDTYNFEVETLHTYVAGGLRVHNDCIHLLPNEVTMTATEKAKYYVDFGNALKDANSNGNKITAFKADGSFNDTEFDLLGKSGLADKGFAFVNTVNSSGQKQHLVNQSVFGQLSNTNEKVTHTGTNKTIDGKNYALLSDTAVLTIDGVTHTAGAIAEAYEIAEKSLIEFAETYKSSINMLSSSLSTALTKTFAELGALVASGQPINSTKIMQKFALNAGISLVTQGLSQTEIAENLSKELDLKLGEGYGDAVTLALIDFGIDAAINSSDWDSNDWVRNGATTVSAYVTPVLLKNNFGISGAEASGITAGLTTFISGVIANPDMNHEEWTNLTVQAGIAGISAFAGIKIGAAIGSVVPGLGTLAGAVVGAVIGTVMSKVFGNVAGVIHLNPGETQTLNAAEDQLWKFAKLGIKETDSNGVEKTVLKDAIYVTNADGVMLNKQAMLDSKSVFRVFNGTVATDTAKANFKPTYLLGGKAADNIIGNNDSEVIYGYDGSDFLDGRGGNNSIFAGGGNDIILAASGRDFIDAGDGDDFVEVEGGNNVIILGKGDDKLYAGGGNDVINAGEGSDVIQAGHGDNIIILGNPTLAEDGAIISDTDISRNEVYAGHGRDNITGSSGRDIIVGDYLDNKGVSDLNTLGDAQVKALGYMNDTIRAGNGGDLVMGGLGQDTIYGGKGNDVLIGGSDLADYSILNFTASDVDFIYGEAGDDIILGDSVDDFNTAEYVNYRTDSFNANLMDDGQGKYGYTQDFLDGGIGDDYIDGGSSDDTIIGGLGQDVLYGGRKVDKITDGEGNDFIIGGIDNDTLISVGDMYNDFFMFGATDGSDIIKGANKYDDVYFNANLRADAIFKREGNNLVITINQTSGTKVTVENHFNGNAINSVVFGNNTRYSLADNTALSTINGGTLNPTYLNNNSTNRFVQLDYRIKEFEADYKDGTSAFAVNEYSTWYDTNYYTATANSNIDAETFNGIQIGYEKRKRGWFGGHYNVFKQIKNTVVNGKGSLELESTWLNGDAVENLGINKNSDAYTFVNDANGNPNGRRLAELYEFNDEFNDLIVGAWWGETIKGLDGDDVIFAGSGIDNVEGGDGNDFINGGDGDDVITGDGVDAGKEQISFYKDWGGGDYEYDSDDYAFKELETSHDLIFGGGGNDTISGGFGNDTLYGDSGNDVINGDTGDDNIEGGSGNDTITDTNSYAIIDGGSGNDIVTSGAYQDLLWGGEGNDTITSGAGDDVIFADEGNDTINLGSGTDFAHGGAGDDFIYGEADNDIIHGGDGTDYLYGGLGINMLIGGYDNDILYSTGKDILIGGAGNDAVSYYYETAGVTINLSGDTPIYGGKAQDDTFDSIAMYYGSNYNDILISSKTGTDFRGYGGDDAITGSTVGENLKGDDGNDIIKGNGGADHMYGGNGNDKIYAGTGDNIRLYGEEGDDTLYLGTGINYADGGNGTDSLTYIYSKTGVTINLGTQTVSGGEATGDTIVGIENAYGSNYNDTIYGTSGVNTLAGYAGNDTLEGFDGKDILNGGDGNDDLIAGSGDDTAYGDNGDDTLIGDAGNDKLYGVAGNDELYGGIGDDGLYGGAGNDTLEGFDGKDIISGGDDKDVIRAGAGNDTAYGDNGDDIIHGDDGSDALYGGLGINMLIGGYDNDILYSTGTDTLIGGAGNDAASYYSETAGVTINLSGDTPIYDGKAKDDTFDSIDMYYGSNYNDILISSKTGTDFRGYGGDDAITGGAAGENLKGDDGNDIIKGNGGADHMYGGNGNDKIYAGTGDNIRLYGEEGDDTLYLGTGINYADGGNGTDSLTYIYSKTGVTINLGTQTFSGGEAAGDTIVGIENAYGSNYNDTIYGTSGVNTLAGYAGNDTLEGYSGDDILDGGAGADTLNGGEGSDTLSYYDSVAAVRVDLDIGIVSGGDAAGDSIFNIENINASNWNDTIIGNDFNNIIKGDAGNDVLHGRKGNDIIYGDAGDDVIHSGANGDKLYGGAGNDIFEFSQNNSMASDRDIIYDFTTGQDKIDVSIFADNVNHFQSLVQMASGITILQSRSIDFYVEIHGKVTNTDFIFV